MNRTDTPRTTPHRGASPGLVLVVVAGIVLIIASLVWMGAVETEVATGEKDVHTVARGDFMISIPASGELSTENLVEIRNPLETNGIVTEIVGEGTTVRKGDFLVQFNQDSIEQRIKDDEDKLVDAQG